tara:strand:+ start:63 stop:1214 length:1152 start_codon:yes stop_codon:yes gene_type:complete
MLRKPLLFVFLLFIILGCSEEEEDVNNQNKEFEFLLEGNPINLSTKLNVSYFNDITVGVKEFRDDYVSLITASGTQTIEITGSSIENLTDSKVVLSPPGSGNLPYANYIGVGQLIKSNNKFYGLYHGEYHLGTLLPGNIPGFYASVGLVTSEDGISFTPSQNPVIPNYVSKDDDNGFADWGYGEPSMLFSKDSTELFVYYVDHNRDNRGVNICMGKFDVIDGEPQFDKFYFLNDQNEFTSSIIKAKEVVSGDYGYSDAIFPHVTYNKFLDLYIMVLSLNAWNDSNNGRGCDSAKSGIYLTYSKDGINWIDPFNENVISYIGSPKKLVSECSIPWSQTSSFAWHPSLIYTNESQTEGYLLYSFGESLSYPGHQLYGNKFKIDLK